MSNILELSDETFAATIAANPGVVLIDFWAPWCGPCSTLAPLLKELAAEYEGEATIVKVNADENKATCEQFNVRGLPTLIVLHQGAEKDRLVGAVSKSRLANALDRWVEA